MSAHLHHEIEQLKKHILAIGALVEEAVRKAVEALRNRDTSLAREVIEGDHEIDRREVRVEEECLRILALHQPVAADLRFIVAVLKVNDELERIGDLAVNLADRAILLTDQPPLEWPFDFAGMAEKTCLMLQRSLDALVNLDHELARQVWTADAEVDAIHRRMYTQCQAAIRDNIDRMEAYIYAMNASRFLERIADHATSIAKDVLYTVAGEIVRHRGREFKTPPDDQESATDGS